VILSYVNACATTLRSCKNRSQTIFQLATRVHLTSFHLISHISLISVSAHNLVQQASVRPTASHKGLRLVLSLSSCLPSTPVCSLYLSDACNVVFACVVFDCCLSLYILSVIKLYRIFASCAHMFMYACLAQPFLQYLVIKHHV
jgi:hypothetical protein